MINMLPFKNYSLNINWTNYKNYNKYKSLLINNTKNNDIPNHINIYIRPLNKLYYFYKKPSSKYQSQQKEEEEEIDNNDNGDLLNKYQDDIKYYHPSNIFCHCCQKKEEFNNLNQLNQSILFKKYDNKFTKCPNKKCNAYLHILCLTKLTFKHNINNHKLQIIPNNVQCPKCKNIAKWPKYIANTLRFIDITIQSDIDQEEEEEQEEEDEEEDDDDDTESDEDDDIGMSLRDRLKKRGMVINK